MRLRMFLNDLRHGLLTNFVVAIFIMMSAMLSCTSISLIYNSMFQISYFMDNMGHAADLNFVMMNRDRKDIKQIEDFLIEQKIDDYEIEQSVNIPSTAMKFKQDLEISSTGCFASMLPQQYNFIFDEQNEIPDIKEGYVGIPLSIKEQLDLTIGDTFSITRDEEVFTYTIQSFIRDSVYGSEMMGQKRFIFNPNDYAKQYDSTTLQEHALTLAIESNENQIELESSMQAQGLPNYTLVTKETAHLSFLGISAGTSAIMMMCGIILLAMSFLIIRFTILFQLENNYTEIGIMKAIGFRHKQIKPLYLSKYMGLCLVATSLGFVLSIPFVQYLEMTQAGVVPIMPGNTGTLLSFLIVPVTIVMVYFITTFVLRKLKKQSVMDAIRKGNEGESYQSVSKMELAKNKHLSLPAFLAINDVSTHLRNSLLMILIYASALLMMLVPLTLKDSFAKDGFLQMLKITTGELYTPQYGGMNVSDLENDQEKLVKDLQSYDSDVQVSIESLSSVTLSDQGINTSGFMMRRADDNAGILFDEGVAPKLKDEIAISSTLANLYHKTIGDSIDVSWEGKTETFLISGIYTSMMNLGNNMLASRETQYSYTNTSYLVVKFSKDETTNQELAQQVLDEYHGRKLIDVQEMMRAFAGDTGNQITDFSNMIIIMMVGITMALTILFSKLQMIKGKQAIALMQSLGYSRKNIRQWQLLRCMIEAIIATLIGCILHYVCTSQMLAFFFEMIGMGKVSFNLDYLHAFVIYPSLFLCSVFIAQIIVNLSLQKWNIQLLSEE